MQGPHLGMVITVGAAIGVIRMGFAQGDRFAFGTLVPEAIWRLPLHFGRGDDAFFLAVEPSHKGLQRC